MNILILLFLSTTIEIIVAFMMLKERSGVLSSKKDFITAIIGANLISYPIAWTVLAIAIIYFTFSWVKAFVFVELFVILVEAVILKLQWNNPFPACLRLSTGMNMMSALSGVILWNVFADYLPFLVV